jgi:acyl-[acyl-carrier-protein] desaturase
MPGTGIEDFSEHARAIARAGIYDYGIHHDQILEPVVLRHWRVESLEGLTPEAEQARERVVTFIERVGRVGERQRERAAASA